MAAWKQGTDRRQTERFKVAWPGTLTCLCLNHEENVEVTVTEVSTRGARLELKTLKVGPYHIVIGSESSRFTLKVSLPEAALWAPVRIVWYSTDQEKDSFNLGVMFLNTSEEHRAAIQRLLADVRLETSRSEERKTGLYRAKDFRAIILDVDGTLLDTLQDVADSMNSTLRHFGFPVHDLEKYKYFIGEGIEAFVRRSLPDSAQTDPRLLSQCVEMMRQTYERNWNVKSRPYPGIPELLDALTARGLKMAVLSNKPHELTQRTIEGFLPIWRFEVVMGESPSVPRKPDPYAALEIAKRLGIEPAGFLYLGDTATDMKTANAAGMYAVGALWGFRNAEELIASGAKKLIAKPAELLELL